MCFKRENIYCLLSILSIFTILISINFVSAVYIDTGAASQNVNDCGTLNTTNAIYTLTQNVTSNSSCFNINANNITLNGAGCSINYSANGNFGHSIISSNYHNITIKNMIIKEGMELNESAHAIVINNSNNLRIENNTITTVNSFSKAIVLNNINNLSIYNNLLNSLNIWGDLVVVNNGVGATIYNNNMSTFGPPLGYTIPGAAIIAHNLTNLNITSNNINISCNDFGSLLEAIKIESTSNSIIAGNSLYMFPSYSMDSMYGIRVSNSSSTKIIKNDLLIETDKGKALFLEDSFNLSVIENNFSTTNSTNIFGAGDKQVGVYLVNISNSIFQNNTILTETSLSYGLVLESSKNNTFNYNLINASNASDVFLTATSDEDCNNNFDGSNIVSGKTLNYSVGLNNLIIDSLNYSINGQYIISSASNLTLKNNNFTKNRLVLCNISNSTINNNQILLTDKSFYAWNLRKSYIENINVSNHGFTYNVFEVFHSSNNTFRNISVFSTTSVSTSFLLSGSSENILTNLNLTGGNNLLQLTNSSCNQISNFSLDLLTTYAAGISLEGSTNNILTNINISSIIDQSRGIYFNYNSDNNIVSNISISFQGSESANGVSLYSNSNNTFSNLRVNVSGLYSYCFYMAGILNSTLTDIICSTNASDSYGIYMDSSNSNFLHNLNITTFGTNSPGIYLTSLDDRNTIVNPFISSKLSRAILDTTGNSYINYLIMNNSFGKIIWTDNNNGRFLKNLTVLKGNLSLDNRYIQIRNNLVFVNSSYYTGEKINSSANVTFYNLPTNFANPKIYRDGNIECNTTTTPICYNFTSLNAGTVVFNVSSWSNYSILDNGDSISPTVNLSFPINGTNTTSAAISFNVTFTDNVNLSNATLSVWNSTNSIINQTTYTKIGTSNSSNVSFTLPYNGNFKWNYLVYDNSSNGAFANANFTINYDSIAPNVTITYPLNQTYNANASNLNYTCSDGAFALYSRDNFVSNSTPVACGTNFTSVLSVQGTNTWRIAVNDTFNNLNMTNVTFFLDSIKPLLAITLPLNTTYTTNVSTLNYTFTETNPGYCWYSNETNNFTPVNCGINFTNILSKEGTNNWVIYSNDTLGNLNSTSITFFLDSIKPILGITFPTNTTYATNVSALNYTFTETNPDYCWYSRDNGITNSTLNTCGTNFTNVVSVQGSNNWRLYMNDSFNNVNMTNVTFFLDSVAPNVTITYPLNQTYNVNVSALNYTCTQGAFALYSRDNFATNSTINACGTNFTNVLSVQGTNVWKIAVNDTFNNLNITNVTFFLDSIAPNVTIAFPINTTYLTNVSTLNYTCEVDSFVWYSIDNGTTNSTINACGINFTSVLSIDGSNNWIVYSNDTFGNLNMSNVTFLVDKIYPTFSGYSDNGGTLTTSGTATFNVTVAKTNGTVKLQINNVNYTASNWTSNSYNVSVALSQAGSYTYYWYSFGNGSLNNLNSTSRSYTVNSAPPAEEDSGESGGGGGGGGGAAETVVKPTTAKTYSLDIEETFKGYTQPLKKGENIEFLVVDFNSGSPESRSLEKHALTLNEIAVDYANVTIRSDPINLTLKVGQSVKLNLTSGDFYDLLVKLESIVNGKAEITIQTIEQERYPGASKASTNANSPSEKQESIENGAEQGNTWLNPKIMIILLVLAILVIFYGKRIFNKVKYGF